MSQKGYLMVLTSFKTCLCIVREGYASTEIVDEWAPRHMCFTVLAYRFPVNTIEQCSSTL